MRSHWSLRQILKVLEIAVSTYHRWRKDCSKGAPKKPRSSPGNLYEALPAERQAIVEYALTHPQVRHRELAWRMLDEGICAVSASTVYRVLAEENLVCRWNRRPRIKGTGRGIPSGESGPVVADGPQVRAGGTLPLLPAGLHGRLLAVHRAFSPAAGHGRPDRFDRDGRRPGDGSGVGSATVW